MPLFWVIGLNEQDIITLSLTLRLALTVTLVLLVLGIPLAWWLSKTQSWVKGPIMALIAMPLVLPPTVLGFYLLLAMGPAGPIGTMTYGLGLGTLAFSFWGLVFGSVIYSLPFVVQPIYNAFNAVGLQPFEVAATLRAGPIDRFFTVALPLAKPGIITASLLGFMHTVGEFGLVLMIGGNIPNETRVVSVQMFEYVEAIEYARAHQLALILVVLSFVSLLGVYYVQKRMNTHPLGTVTPRCGP